MAKITGGGISGNKNVNVGVRTGAASKGSSPAAAGQIGASTAFKRDQVDAQRGYNASQLGNALATNVGKGGPGTGRTVMPCGSQGTHGPVAGQPRPPGRDILSSFGPEKSKG
jgi:hypothetical protein